MAISKMQPLFETYLSMTPGASEIEVGKAYISLSKGSITTTFNYSQSYLGNPNAYEIDPLLPLSRTTHSCAGIPGAFSDSSPDRWGRNILFKRMQALQGSSGNALRKLDEVDYLLGADDATRQGALRFRLPEKSEFESSGEGVPKTIELPALMRASEHAVAAGNNLDEIKLLLDAGTASLGGARPKASVRENNKLYIAKFPHPEDEWDVMAWEKWSLELAQRAGISTPYSKLVVCDKKHVLLLERFDRLAGASDKRIGYLSAMSALSATDGSIHDYAELAEVLPLLVTDIAQAYRELYLRIVLSVALHNTDDHLRNHGFLRTGDTWVFSPAFDINPNPYGNSERQTSIGGYRGLDEVEGLEHLAVYCGLNKHETALLVRSVLEAFSSWQDLALKLGCTAKEVQMFMPIINERTKALEDRFLQ